MDSRSARTSRTLARRVKIAKHNIPIVTGVRLISTLLAFTKAFLNHIVLLSVGAWAQISDMVKNFALIRIMARSRWMSVLRDRILSTRKQIPNMLAFMWPVLKFTNSYSYPFFSRPPHFLVGGDF